MFYNIIFNKYVSPDVLKDELKDILIFIKK